MSGSLALHGGVLWVAWHARAARVRAFDLDGRPLTAAFSVRDRAHAWTAAAGIAVDDHHRLWMADTPADRVRCLSLFGREIGAIAGRAGSEAGALGHLEAPSAVGLAGADGALWIGMGGVRCGAVQLASAGGEWLWRLASEGDPRASFQGVRRVRALGERVWVCESLARRVQVFRNGNFEFLFRLPIGRGGDAMPTAVAPLEDGRALVTLRGAGSALVLVGPDGAIQRALAGPGSETGSLVDPSDVVVEGGAGDPRTRVAVIDRDGERVQVFGLEGRCHGAFEELAG